MALRKAAAGKTARRAGSGATVWAFRLQFVMSLTSSKSARALAPGSYDTTAASAASAAGDAPCPATDSAHRHDSPAARAHLAPLTALP
jgi:hypothetical protein